MKPFNPDEAIVEDDHDDDDDVIRRRATTLIEQLVASENRECIDMLESKVYTIMFWTSCLCAHLRSIQTPHEYVAAVDVADLYALIDEHCDNVIDDNDIDDDDGTVGGARAGDV